MNENQLKDLLALIDDSFSPLTAMAVFVDEKLTGDNDYSEMTAGTNPLLHLIWMTCDEIKGHIKEAVDFANRNKE